MDLDDGGDSAECLLCYEERDSVEPAPCCGKGVCGRCRRMLERRAGAQAPLCPFCRRPASGARRASLDLRGCIVQELCGFGVIGNTVDARAWRVLTLVTLAPGLPLALREAAEALLHVASSSRQGLPPGRGLAAVEVAGALCRQWPSTAGLIVQSLRNFWDDLDVAGSMMSDEVGSVVDYAEVLVLRSILAAADVFAIVRLRHRVTCAAQSSFACLLVRRLESSLGRPRVMKEIFAEAELEGCCAGMFPLEGHPADVTYIRELYEGAGLAWLCDHDSFSTLAMLSDSE